VIWISGEPIALGDATYIDWGKRALQTEEVLQ